MKFSPSRVLTCLFLTSLIFSSLPAFGQAPAAGIEAPGIEAAADEQDDPAVARVARLSFVDGEVSFLRAQVTEWADAIENLPLLAGDQIYTGAGARAEVQLGRGAYLRLSEKTALTISDLSENSAQFEITEGIAVVRLDKSLSSLSRFEVDTPNSALLLERDGIYRINVRGDEDSEVIVRRGAAEVTTVDGTFKLREGNRLSVDTSETGKLEIVADTSLDDWDRWSYDRDNAIDTSIASASPDYVNQYESTYDSFYGASELSNYGTWTSVSSYGHCWVPRVGSGWAPYRDGQWLWVPAIGWTWLSNEPWGWAPYHYGRWVYAGRLGWVWSPGFRSNYYYGHSYYRWRPALVSFFYCPTPRGNYVGWYPLAPGERWRRADHNRRDRDRAHLQYPGVRDGARRPDDSRAWRRPDRADGVTLQPVSGFARGDKNRVRPTAPTRDFDIFLRDRARPGLPEVPASDLAAAPGWRNGQALDKRPDIAKPSEKVLRRPVVTRSRPSNPTVGSSAPRERHVLTPRKPIEVTESFRRDRTRGQLDTGQGQNFNQPRTGGVEKRPDPRVRPTRPPAPEAGGENASSNERVKNEAGGGSETRNRPRNKPEPEGRRQKDSDERTDTNRAPRPSAPERHKERDDRPRPDSDTSSRPRPERNSPKENNEPRRERPPAPPSAERNHGRQEHKQERQERRPENADRGQGQRKKN
ncbi:MAG TPA: DUF6600 domain-containing protein [Blastocatellia bacterium]|nr:DUF6600 domain-containing protein [Blastocatellia bacterium]